jgi:hypothetical protein
MTQKIAHTHPERARDRRDRGQCGIDLAGLDPRHMLLRKPRLSGQHGLRQPRSSTRRAECLTEPRARWRRPRSRRGPLIRGHGKVDALRQKVGGGAPDHLGQQGHHAQVRVSRAAFNLNEGSQSDAGARGNLPTGQPRAEAGGPKIVSEQDFDAMREFVMRHETPRVSADEGGRVDQVTGPLAPSGTGGGTTESVWSANAMSIPKWLAHPKRSTQNTM